MGVPDSPQGRSLEFNDVLSLRAFGPLDHLKFHFLVFLQSAEAISLNGAVVHEHVRAVFPGDEAIPLGVIKPFDFAGFSHSFPYSCKNVGAVRAERRILARRQKKIGKVRHTLPISGIKQDVRPYLNLTRCCFPCNKLLCPRQAK
jgi:hypothetical protein